MPPSNCPAWGRLVLIGASGVCPACRQQVAGGAPDPEPQVDDEPPVFEARAIPQENNPYAPPLAGHKLEPTEKPKRGKGLSLAQKLGIASIFLPQFVGGALMFYWDSLRGLPADQPLGTMMVVLGLLLLAAFVGSFGLGAYGFVTGRQRHDIAAVIFGILGMLSSVFIPLIGWFQPLE